MMLFLLLLALTGTVCAQPPDTLWTRTYGGATEYSEQALALCPTLDGGFVLAGITYETDQILVVRTDDQGNPVWMRRYGTDPWNYATTVQAMPNGDFLVAGYTDNVLMYASRIDAVGDTLWSRTYQRLPESNDIIQASVAIRDGGALLVGTSNTGRSVVWALRIDADGDTIWTFSYGDSVINARGFAVGLAPDSGFVISGGQWTDNGNDSDFLLLRLTAEGDFVWARTYGTGDNDRSFSVLSSPEGGFIMAGDSYDVEHGMVKVYLVRTDDHGDTLWTRIYDGFPSIITRGLCLAPGGGYVAVGTTYVNVAPWDQHILALRVDDRGDTLWSRLFCRYYSDNATCILPTPDGGYVIGGYSLSPDGSYDMYLVKTRPGPFAIDERSPASPSDFSVNIFPNPFNSSVTFTFTLPRTTAVTLSVFNTLGQRVREVNLGQMAAGEHRYLFEAGALPSGVYLARVEAAGRMETRKVVRMR
ncbi:MAG: T9SS type A sorting domain-containing protein [bacterium]|nr:T9SS type A sorting domain-containing protein [bacterium]